MDKAVYDGLKWNLDGERLRAFDDLSGGIKNSLVLDVGAGENSALTQFLYDCGAVVVALDKVKKELKPNPHIKIQADAEHLPFRDNSFDLVVTENLVIYSTHDPRYLHRPEFMIQEAFRILKPGKSYISFDYGVEPIDLGRVGFDNIKKIIANSFLYGRKP